MAKTEIETSTLETLIAAFGQSIKDIAPKKEIREGDPEYVARQQAEGWFDDFDGGVKVFQNAYEAQPRGLSEEVRYRAAHLKPGKYIRNRVTVDVDNQGVHLKYPVSGDAMLINRDYFSSFSDLITKIWDEMHATVPA